jgi:hypothetical protein
VNQAPYPDIIRGSDIELTAANPAAGAQFNSIGITGFTAHVLSIQFQLVTSAVAANRKVRVVCTFGTTQFDCISGPYAQTASLTWTWRFHINGGNAHLVTNAPPALGHIQPFLKWKRGDTISVLVDNLDGGDQLSGLRIACLQYPD